MWCQGKVFKILLLIFDRTQARFDQRFWEAAKADKNFEFCSRISVSLPWRSNFRKNEQTFKSAEYASLLRARVSATTLCHRPKFWSMYIFIVQPFKRTHNPELRQGHVKKSAKTSGHLRWESAEHFFLNREFHRVKEKSWLQVSQII